MASMKALIVYVALTALTLLVFALWPGLDPAVSHLFYDGGGGFIGHERLARLGRDFFRVTPFVVLTLYAAFWLAKRKGVRLRWAPSGRAVIFLIATIAIGPGLVVNLGLKDHWHRPRPVNTQEFNGANAFKPWYEGDGACKKNCSFVSGEAATGFWMVGPASVAPLPWRGPAIAAAFAFGIGASLLRMAFGGHYLSDVLLGGLVTLIVIEVARKIFWPRGSEEKAQIRLLDAARDSNAAETGRKEVSPATPNGFADRPPVGPAASP
jgi:membrane-associated phospholipid phosphatase